MKRFLVVLLMAFVGLSAFAQDWSAEPTYGTIELEWGFEDDPYVLEVLAGGSVNLSRSRVVRGLGASGYVADAPDLDLEYEAGDYSLYIFVDGYGADTVLLVNDPEGNWHFNDDYDGIDPMIVFDDPLSGLYDIWIGTYYDDEMEEVDLYITEFEDMYYDVTEGGY